MRQEVVVLEAGLLTTVQDLGRPGHAAWGVSASGAADPLSLRAGNLLVGNPEGAGALELTLQGGALRFDDEALVAVTGSDLSPTIESGAARRPLALWAAEPVAAGTVVRFGTTRSGARSYLCVRGGIDLPPVLGSVSTHLLTGLGGFEGRALRSGDRLPIGLDPGAPARRMRIGADEIRKVPFRKLLRVTPGPQEGWFTSASLARFVETEYEVSEEANRMGLRLLGPALDRSREDPMLTEGVCLGDVQVPESGRPIVLFAEQQTTGGYPKIACVVCADLPALGQLRPRDRIRFEWTTLESARALLREQERLLANALESI